MQSTQTTQCVLKAFGFAVVAGLSLGTTGLVAADDTVIYNSCKTVLLMTDSECDCVVSEVHNSLNENQLEFFTASLKEDQSAMIAAQSKISQDEMLHLANFMTTTPNSCKGK